MIALVLILATSLALTPAQAAFESAKATYRADMATAGLAYQQWQSDPEMAVVVEGAITAAITDWEAIEVAPCFRDWWALRYVSLLGLVDTFATLEGRAIATPLGNASGYIASLANAAEATVTC